MWLLTDSSLFRKNMQQNIMKHNFKDIHAPGNIQCSSLPTKTTQVVITTQTLPEILYITPPFFFFKNSTMDNTILHIS